MAKLGFLKAYRPLVMQGSKTTTLRRWKKPMVRVGQIVKSSGVGQLEIAAVDCVEWAGLTEADAKADGFATLADLNRAVRRIYPRLDGDGRSWFKVRFRVVVAQPGGQARRTTPRKGKSKRGTVRAGAGRVGLPGTMSLSDKAKLATAVRQPPMVAVR